MLWAIRAACAFLALPAAVSCTGDVLDSPLHDTARNYLDALAEGTSTAAHEGACEGVPKKSGSDELAAEGAGFRYELTGSVESGDSAIVNVTVTGQDGTPSPYAVDLLRENGRWVVCGVSTGNVQLDGA